MKKPIFLIYMISLLLAASVYGQSGIALSVPRIYEGTVINDSFYTGPIALEATYTGEEPFMGLDKEAYYTLDAQSSVPLWNPVSIEEKSIEYDFPLMDDMQTVDSSCARGFADGRMIIVWKTVNAAGYQSIHFQLFDAAGNKSGNEVKVNTVSNIRRISATDPDVALHNNGNFIIVWDGIDTGSFNRYKVYGRLFDTNGNPLDEGESELNYVITTDDNFQPSVLTTEKEIISVWVSRRTEGENAAGIEALRYDYDGNLINKTVLLQETGDHYFLYPQIAALNEREYILLWGQLSTGIFLRKLVLSDNTLQLAGSRVTLTQQNPVQKSLKVEALSGNGFIAVWSRSEGSGVRLYGQHFDDSCQAAGAAFRIDNYNDNTNSAFPHISPADDGGFLVCWRDYNFTQKQGAVMVKRYSAAMNQVYESVVKEKNTEITAFSACATSRKTLLTAWADRISSSYQRKAAFYPAQKRAYTGMIASLGNIDIRFKLIDPVMQTEWVSPVRSYLNANPGEGADSTITYPGGFTNENLVQVEIGLEEGSYKAIAFYEQKAQMENGRVGSFGEWEPYGAITTQTRVMDVTLTGGYAYKFKYTITNVADITYEIAGGNILGCDLSAPRLQITGDQLEGRELRLTLEYEDQISGLDGVSYRLNNGNPVAVTAGQLEVVLEEGPNHLVLEAEDRAGNRTTRHLFKTAESVIPGIRLTGLKEGGEYGADLVFGYEATVAVSDVGVYIDNEFVETAGAATVSTNLTGYPEGNHRIAVRGRTKEGEWLEGAVTIRLKQGVFNLVLLSPQEGQRYGSRTVPIEYWAGEEPEEVWWELDGGGRQEGVELTGLANGSHELVFHAVDRKGNEASVPAVFSVKEVFPELNVISPVNGQVCPGKEIELLFETNAAVRYELGEENGSAESGTVLTVPGDGEYELTLAATHPVSGNTVRETLKFVVDSVAPELEIITPEARLYGYNEINVDYRVNKAVKSVRLLLDGEEVDGLTNLEAGAHRFEVQIEDYADRRAEKRVDFTVARLEIVKPEEGARIVSDRQPPDFSFVYEKEGNFDSLTRALDDNEGELIGEPPGQEIPMTAEAGKHELHLRGYMDEFEIARRSRFQIGRKNLRAGAGSINYSYRETGISGEYEVKAVLTIANTGDLDIDENIQVRFDYINQGGYAETYRKEVTGGLKSKAKAEIEVENLAARFGDHFLMTIDPDNRLSGEYRDDNSWEIEFQTGQITGIAQALSAENVYLQKVSVFNAIEVSTAGSIAYVELHTNSKVFVDDTPENGFRSIVDMGLLSPEKNYVQVLAYGFNNVVLDSRKLYFNVRILNHGRRSHVFPWAQFASGQAASRTARSFDPDRIIMNAIDAKNLAEAQSQAIRNSLLSASTVIPVIEENEKVIYKIFSIENSLSNAYETLDIENVPVLEGRYNLPNGKGYINITSFDPANEICVPIGAIPILDGGTAFVEMINGMWQKTIAGIDQMIEENLDLENMLDDLVNATLADLDPVNWRFGSLFFISYDFFPGLLGAFFFGFMDYSVNDRLRISASDINMTADFEAEACLVCKEPGNIFSGYDIEARARFNLQAHSNINISTPGLNAAFLGFIGVRFFRFIYIPLFIGGGQVQVKKQNLNIPLNLYLNTNLLYSDGVLKVAPAHARFRASCQHNKRLATGTIEAYLLILPLLGAGADVNANLKIDAAARADLVLSMKPDFLPELKTLYYAGGRVDVDVHVVVNIYINLILFRIKIPVYSTNININQEGHFGEEYSDTDVQKLMEEGTIAGGV